MADIESDVLSDQAERLRSGGASVAEFAIDVSDAAQVAALREFTLSTFGSVHLLFNNAGGMTDRLVMTDEGLEANYAGNHLGPLVLTSLLLPLLRAATSGLPDGAVRILMTSSDASEMIPGIDLDDLQNLANFSPGLSYCAGKLANVLFAKGLAVRLAGSGIVAHSMAPGPVASNFYSYAPAETRKHMEHLEMLHVTCSQHIQLADSTCCVASLHAPHPQPPASH